MAVSVNQHIGRKIERIRILKGVKQETLASELGVTQGAVSRMEQSEGIHEGKLGRIAEILGVSAEMIKNFNEEAVFNNFIEKDEVINQNCEVSQNWVRNGASTSRMVW